MEQLASQFEAGEHRSRVQGGKELTYVDIAATINRVNDILGPNVSYLPESNTSLTIADNGKYLAYSQIYLKAVIDGVETTLYGCGAMVNGDPDMAVKTALAEAYKKAWHGKGVALYLWDEEAREDVERRRKLSVGTLETKKRQVYNLAQTKLGIDRPTPGQMAELFEVPIEKLSDEDTIMSILKKEGVL
jgi:hypothetical protein